MRTPIRHALLSRTKHKIQLINTTFGWKHNEPTCYRFSPQVIINILVNFSVRPAGSFTSKKKNETLCIGTCMDVDPTEYWVSPERWDRGGEVGKRFTFTLMTGIYGNFSEQYVIMVFTTVFILKMKHAWKHRRKSEAFWYLTTTRKTKVMVESLWLHTKVSEGDDSLSS